MIIDPASSELVLGIEGGATRTVALLADAQGRLVRRIESGPSNLRLLSDHQLLRSLRDVARDLPRPAAIGIGMAGARDEKDWDRVTKLAGEIWPEVPCRVTHDLATALAAAEIQSKERGIPRVIVLSGTGSCCYGGSPDGKIAKIGGWGHILGDKGSGFEIGLRALKAVVYYLDRDGTWSRLGERLLRTLQLNQPGDLIDWVKEASKDEIAALAVEVFTASAKRDLIARDILEGAASSLAKDAVNCAERIAKPDREVEFVFAGSVLLKQRGFRRKVERQIAQRWPRSRCASLRIESAWGAVALARSELQVASCRFQVSPSSAETVVVRAEELSPTEQRHARSMNLHKLSMREGIRLMLSEEARVTSALRAQETQIERGLKLIVRAFRRGGRLFYVGAGTSGRLGVLDASECPPTFRTPPELVQGIIAGGQRALWQAVEGAEDDAATGAGAVRFRGVTHKDVVVGIAASGRTPFVWGAIAEAKRREAATILICFNPRLRMTRAQRPNVVIAPEVAPEILTGSTRLKCGTATKLILNIFTTLAMVKLGKVMSNLMIDVNPSNAKLRQRAVRILQDLTNCEAAAARAALEKSGWVIKEAWRRWKGGETRQALK